MKYFTILCLFAYISVVHAATEPYLKSDVPWAVYLPENATDTKGDTDAGAFLHGNDVGGWYTYMVFKADGTHITNNADLYASGTPIINEADHYNQFDLSKDPEYIICKFILIQPATSPSVGIDGSPASSSYVDMATKQLTFGHEEHALHYKPTERKIENVTIGRDYWLAARETPKKLWRIIYGDNLWLTPTGTLAQELATVITSKSDYSGGTDNNEMSPVSDITNFVINGAATNEDERFVKHEIPIMGLNWFEAQEFLNKLTLRTGGKTARLPNEYEWEYAARAGNSAEYPKGFFSGNSKNWYLSTPSVSGDAQVTIESVFDKVHQIPDIPRTVIQEYTGSVQTGTNADGSAIMENKIVALRFVVDPRLEATRDFRIVVGNTINYDHRYPANIKPFSSRNFWLDSDGTSFVSARIEDEVDGDGVKTGVQTVITMPKTGVREYYPDADALARAANNYYMGVKEDGSYAARLADESKAVGPTNPYVYDPELVHHFVKLTGDDIWPPSHPSSSPMNVNNTVLSYLYWRTYDKNVTFLGSFPNPKPLYDQAREELIAQVRNHAFENTPGDYDHGGKVYIPEKSNIATDFQKAGGSDKGSMAISIDIPAAHGGNKSHKWYYVSAWKTHGKTITENQHQALLNGDPMPDREYPIDGFHPGPATRESSYKYLMGGNDWGFENMLGNVAEFVLPVNQTSDGARWDGLTNYEYYVNRGDFVITRGGGWNTDVTGIRYASRKGVLPTNRSLEIGFRILIEQ